MIASRMAQDAWFVRRATCDLNTRRSNRSGITATPKRIHYDSGVAVLLPLVIWVHLPRAGAIRRPATHAVEILLGQRLCYGKFAFQDLSLQRLIDRSKEPVVVDRGLLEFFCRQAVLGCARQRCAIRLIHVDHASPRLTRERIRFGQRAPSGEIRSQTR